ncbi:MAG TPA: stage III sporulation protein AF [Candidatus Merdenecus merdavium]|nr:stage III sporulation protein AF [Candidatus Merdenecus merdavium]
MLEGFYGWIKNIAFFYIFVTMIMNLVPNNSYRKYIQFFIGILLILVIITPMMNRFGIGKSFDAQVVLGEIKEGLHNLEGANKGLEDLKIHELKKGYQLEIEKQIETIVLARGLYPVKVEVELSLDEKEEESLLTSVSIIASRTKLEEEAIIIEDIIVGQDRLDSVEEINIKNDIEDVYNISISNINISIQG